MMEILFMVFMIPIFFINMWSISQLLFIVLMIMFMTKNSIIFLSSVSYFLAMDFLSYGLIMLTFLISSLMTLSFSKNSINFINLFVFVNLLLCFCLFVIFTSTNLFILYIFFEFSLIPLLIMIFGWGYQPERLISGLYLFFYTLFASLPLLLFVIKINMINGHTFWDMSMSMNSLFVINLSMLLAFLVKLPMFMFHFWLPKAHVQAPVFGSMILAGLLLKIGGYGIIRFSFIYENLFYDYSYIWYSLSIMGAILVSFICFIQADVKSMIAYSSVAHMSLCITSVLTMNKWGLFGNYMLMLSHGLCSSGLFCLISISYERYLSRSFYINKGLQSLMPTMSLFWFLFCLCNMSCPPSLNFISEVFILISMISYWNYSFIFFIFISFLSACFNYYLFSFTQHNMNHILYCYSGGFIREYLLLMVHLLPIILIPLMLNFVF